MLCEQFIGLALRQRESLRHIACYPVELTLCNLCQKRFEQCAKQLSHSIQYTPLGCHRCFCSCFPERTWPFPGLFLTPVCLRSPRETKGQEDRSGKAEQNQSRSQRSWQKPSQWPQALHLGFHVASIGFHLGFHVESRKISLCQCALRFDHLWELRTQGVEDWFSWKKHHS